MDRGEVEAYRTRHHRIRAVIWWSFVLVALGIGFGVGLVWSLLAGAIVTVALIAAFQPLHLWVATRPHRCSKRQASGGVAGHP
jgi:hypothetical protein